MMSPPNVKVPHVGHEPHGSPMRGEHGRGASVATRIATIVRRARSLWWRVRKMADKKLVSTAMFVFDAADEVKGPGVRITPELFYKYLPREFYPIHDRADLLRKAYMGIVA